MAEAAQASDESSFPSRLARALPDLLTHLRAASFDVGTEQYLSACDLLFHFNAAGHIPGDDELRASLSSIFCTSAAEQERFAEIFKPWHERLTNRPAPKPDDFRRKPPDWIPISPKDRKRAWFWASAVCLLLVVVGATYYYWLSPKEPIELLSPPAPAAKVSPPPKIQTKILISPRQPPEAAIPPPQYTPRWVAPARWVWLAPVFLWLLWCLKRVFLRQIVIRRRRERKGEAIRLDYLNLAGAKGELFSAPALAETWRHLRRFRSTRSQRLDEAATIQRTLDSGGFFQPVYRERQVPPAYLFLVDRRHAEDHVAALSDELGNALRRENVQITMFSFDEDPRYCTPVGEIASERGPAVLAGVYGDRELLFAGDGDALFDPATGAAQPWLGQFSSFEGTVMLTTNPVSRQRHQFGRLTEAGFRLLPLTPAGLRQLGTLKEDVGYDDPRDLPVPRRFAIDPGYWLEDRSPKRSSLNAPLNELRDYLGREGFLLLSATAAYPGIYWRLTRALDAELRLNFETRPLRLRKLARLPWYRHGRMPDYLRIALLRSLGREDFSKVSNAFNSLIDHRDDNPIHLPIALPPDWAPAKGLLRELAQSSPRHEPLGDRVFADVVRGRKPRLLEFALAGWRAPWLDRRGWRGLALPILAGLFIIPGAVWLNVWAWQSWLAPVAQRQAVTSMRLRHQDVRITLEAAETLQPMTIALGSTLSAWEFKVLPTTDEKKSPTTRRGMVGALERVQQSIAGVQRPPPPNLLIYRADTVDDALVEIIANRVSYLYYGVYPEVRPNKNELPDNADVLIELHDTPRGFRDRLGVTPAPAVGRTFRDKLKIEGDGPEMIVIPAGSFQMGDLQGKVGKAGIPVHTVQFSKPVALSRFEVTFDDYDLFAKATNRKLPGDSGWGRGKRPVINVSWGDAQAYTKWLSEQTGKRYRLPSEAEWEYAARAGTKAEYWWGDDIRKGQANCDGCGSQWDNKQTAPVGSFKANPFGLHDTAGNVWEWVEDCWHENYNGAPRDGRAWGRENDGDCGRRVIRGGSWFDGPWSLRSSNRSGDSPVSRNINIGFRLVQDIE